MVEKMSFASPLLLNFTKSLESWVLGWEQGTDGDMDVFMRNRDSWWGKQLLRWL